MPENSNAHFLRRQSGRWRRRIVKGRWILAAAALVLAYCVVAANLPVWVAIAGYLVIAAAVIFGPRVSKQGSDRPAVSATEHAYREAFVLFADTLPDPCFLLNHRSALIHGNDPASKQFPGTAIGKPITLSIRHPELRAAIERARASGAPQRLELHFAASNHTWFSVFVAPLRLAPKSGSRGIDWIVVSMFDLTEQKRIEAMRGDFVANASHELRTPLTSVIGFIDTLQGPAANDEAARARFLDIMRNQAGRMSNLIDDLLSLSRIELHQHVRPTEEVNLSRVLEEVVEGLETQAKSAAVTVDLSVPETIATVTGDPNQLYEVFENLIDNAIKYGASGEKIDIKLIPTERLGFAYLVTVTDYGAGVAPEHVPRLTERFYRVETDVNRQKKGTGLGLAIVKHILNRHGATMNIRSKPDIGTTVEILFLK